VKNDLKEENLSMEDIIIEDDWFLLFVGRIRLEKWGWCGTNWNFELTKMKFRINK
jgi:hypothetical protein